MKTCMYLSRDFESDNEQLSPWLRLTLTTRDSLPQYHMPQNVDTRNICFAWISAKQNKSISKLTGGFDRQNSNVFTVIKRQFVRYDDLFDEDENLVFDDTLTIVCAASFNNDNYYIDSWLVHPAKSVVVDNTDHTLVKDLRRMLETGQGSDVTLVASDGREFAAHVTILSSRAPFFAKMFEHNMQEKQEKRVIIKDLDSDAVEGLLEFMYTDEVSNITPIAVKLLPKADEYDIPKLKTLCEESLAPKLNSENAAEFLLLADMHHASQLREAAKHFIATHWKDVKATDGWTQLINHNSLIIYEITDIMAELVF